MYSVYEVARTSTRRSGVLPGPCESPDGFSGMTAGDPGRAGTQSEIRALLILFLVAFALRPQLVGAAALIGDVSEDFGFSHALAGFVGTVPVLCMGIFAFVAPAVRRQIGTRSTLTLALALIAVGGLLRALSPAPWTFMLLTIGIGIGIGIGGAVLPVVVRQMLPAQPVEGTAAYSAGLQLGSAISAASAALLAIQFGGWQGALAVLSASTLLPLAIWWLAGPASSQLSETGGYRSGAQLDRQAIILALVFGLFGTVYYGFIAWLPDAYGERGWSAPTAGALVAALNIASLVGALSIAFITRRVGYAASAAVMAVAFALASVGFVVASAGGLGWAVLAGYANGALFPLLLAQPARVAEAPDHVARISAVMLGGGYMIAAVAPVALGALRDSTGSFGPSFGVLAGTAVLLMVLTSVIARQPVIQH